MTTLGFPILGTTRYFWRTCPCREALYAADAEQVARMDAAYRQQQAERELGDTGMRGITHMTLESFVPGRLRVVGNAEHPYGLARKWLHAALAYGESASYQDAESPPAALYFYSPGKGRGKTHLAAGIAETARRCGKLSVFLHEHSYLERRWSCAFEELERLSALPGDRAWLTVIDDIGQRANAGPSVADAWYAVLNRRWLKAGWTIITSNKTPDELVKQGTINDATFSRLGQMFRGHLVYFDGRDARMEAH